MTKQNTWKWLLGMPLAALMLGWAWLALADGNKTLTVRVVQEKQIQVALPAEFSQRPVPITYMQFTDMEWNATTNEIAAGIAQGPWVPIVNVDTGQTRMIRTGERGGDRKVTWIPGSAQLMTVGSLLKATDWNTNLQVYDTQGDLTKPILVPQMNRPDFLKGVVMPDGKQAVLSFGEPRIDWLENGISRYKDGIKNFIFFHEAPGWEGGKPRPFFPQDGKKYYADSSGVDVQQVGNAVLVAVVGLRQEIGPPIRNEFLTWVVDVVTGKTLCSISTYPDPGGDKLDRFADGSWSNESLTEGVALSSNGRWLAVRNSKHLDVFDVATCRHAHRLWTYPKIGIGGGFHKNIAFTQDEQYLVTIGHDVRSHSGGYVNVWRMPDGKQVYHADINTPASLVVDPRARRFAVEFGEGELVIYRIDD